MTSTVIHDARQIGQNRLTFHADRHPRLNALQLQQIETVRAEILRARPTLDTVPPFGTLCTRGFEDLPSLVIEDHSAIQLAMAGGANQNLSYRAAMLARAGDLLVVHGQRDKNFERYCRERVGLGSIGVSAIDITDPTVSLASAALADGHLMAHAISVAQSAGGLNILPYMATGGIWRLAAEIASAAQKPVRIAGPGPNLMRAVNDKLWFARWASRLLRRDAVPHARDTHGMGALVGHLRRFMTQHRKVAIKLSHSAASMGNIVLESSALNNMTAAEIAEHLKQRMEQRGWLDPFPLQVTAWEGPVIASPSAQLWIPLPADGPPIIEGIFDQLTIGEIARFAGGMPSELGESIKAEMAHEAAMLGRLFQSLGYFGRCSFDALVIGECEAGGELHWVECNGRWGGISIPLTLANRLVGDWRDHGFLVFSHHDPSLAEIGVNQFVDRYDHVLLRAGEENGAVLLAPGTLRHGRIDMLILAQDQPGALAIADEFMGAGEDPEIRNTP
ncbi:hypothetical protein FGU71_06955 [Erythrobacter insulae]|uniref:Pre ATP-grasp domain-containing protein n=1 Tax=Erythrobacter insulae TaxID=2584124 RepID=A0A547PBW2_9SPHN|nr:hypothetical protein [Erythrobacter insulae]TRD11628.1 hypothetical protein FGU71_06955 [Erythrobacter insulae]